MAEGKNTPIRVGDRFETASGILEVIETRPGGHVELMDREKTRFHHRYTRDMRDWKRIAKAEGTPNDL